MGKCSKKILIALLIMILIVVSYPIWLPLPAKFLMVKDNIQKADAVIVLSGDWYFDRERKAIELYKKGWADRIIRIVERENILFDMMKKLLNSSVTQEDVYAKYFESQGVAKDAIILEGMIATSTFDELKAFKDIILKNNYKAVILVTSDYHMRRALMTMKRLFRNTAVRIYNATIHSSGFNPNRWWLYEKGIKEVVFEYLSIGFYLVYHFMLGR